LELLVVVVLGTLLVMVVSQVLVTNSRVYGVSVGQIQDQQIMRAGMDVLLRELREISIHGEDLEMMDRDQLLIRAQRAFGLVCDADYSTFSAGLTVVRVGSWFRAGDSIFVLADNDPQLNSDDVWLARMVQSVDTTAVCGGRPAQVITVQNLASTGDTVRVGAPVRAFQRFRYGAFQIDGETYLGRQTMGASAPDHLAGPVVPAGGVVFRYLDALEQAATVPTDVAQIEVTLRYESDARRPGGETVENSIVARVHPRN
jgi:hypothetical protein